MPIYCDESGGVGAGVMVMASLSLDESVAASAMAHVAGVMGLSGELKGSRLSMAERAFVIEVLMRVGARAMVVEAHFAELQNSATGKSPADHDIYARLIEKVADHWISKSGGCIAMVIDDGRYDDRLNALLRSDVQQALGQWGKASLADSRRSYGVQFADVIANSHFHVAVASGNAKRVETLLDPFWSSGQIRRAPIKPAPLVNAQAS